MLGKKQSSYVGFNPFSKYTKEKPSITTKIINKLKSMFQINLNPSSCIQRELISQQTIYVPVNSEIFGAQTIEQDSIQIHNSQSSCRQKRNKFTSFDDHLKEQQNILVQQNDQSSKVKQKEEKHLRKINSQKQSYEPVLPEDIDQADIQDNKIIQPRRKLSSQQYKKRKLDEKKKSVGIKFIHKKHIQDQIQDSINESRIQEVPEQISDDSLKNNSLLAGGLKEEPQIKEIIIVQLKDEKSKQPEPLILNANEIIEFQSKGLKKSQSMINLNEQESKAFSCSPKNVDNSQSRKQSDVLSKPNEIKQIELQKEQHVQFKEQKTQDDKNIESLKQPQQTIINFLVQGPTKLDKPQTIPSLFNNLQKELIEDKKPIEQHEKNFNNLSDTPLFGIFKNSENLQGQQPHSKINVQSSLFASYDSKDLNQQQSSDQSSGQNLQQNQFTFLQNKPNNQEAQQQPSNSESSSSNVNNKKDSLDVQPKIEENNQIYSNFNNTTGIQNDQFNTNDQFRTKKLFQNFINVSQSIQGEQKEEKKQDQVVENLEVKKKPEEQKQVGLFAGITFVNPEIKNNVDNNNIKLNNNKETPIPQFSTLFNKLSNDNNNKEKQSGSLLFGGTLFNQTEKEKPEVKVDNQPPFLNNVNSIQINKIQEKEDKETANSSSLFASLFKIDNKVENKINIDTPTNQENKQQQSNSQKQEILTPLHNSMGLNCQWKSSSDDQKKNNLININSSDPKPVEQQKQSPFAFSQKQIPQIDNTKSENLSSDPLIKQVATPVKQIDNPFLQQSPKIDQEQIHSYFSNNSCQSRIPQEEPAKVQTSQFQNSLFKQQSNALSQLNTLLPQPQQSQTSIFSFQQNSQQNQFQQQNSLFSLGVNTNRIINNNAINNQMEITDMNQAPPQQFQFGQQMQTQNTFGSFLQPQLGTNGLFSQTSSQTPNLSAISYFQNMPLQQNELATQLFQPPLNQQSGGLFQQDPPKTTNQSQSLNSSFQSKNGKKKQRI
ncbi:unnamed protein product [Paramecium sonneborni]|uniref:Uncharacterized protein n=1 Tax=Paramecium sonneborni TaxID=65129 RepID=A0A8S1N3W2_9CILI|nr:unnamed protein product [Paramecium sonneborni]